jgi:hypothetical protein
LEGTMVEDDGSNQYKRDNMERWMFGIGVESENERYKRSQSPN